MPRVIAFDVNETLLDLKAMDAQFERVFRTVGVRQEWFKQVLQSALLTTILDAYADFVLSARRRSRWRPQSTTCRSPRTTGKPFSAPCASCHRIRRRRTVCAGCTRRA
jgi:hypothetical protein